MPLKYESEVSKKFSALVHSRTTSHCSVCKETSMKPTRMRFWSLAVAICMLFSLNAQQSFAAQPLESSLDTQPAKSKSKVSLNDSTVNRYIVELKGEPTAYFAKRLRPSKDAFAKFDVSNPTIQNYTNQLVSKRNTALQQVEQVLGREPRIIDVFDMVFYGFAIDATEAEMRQIARLPQVVSYEIEPVYELLTDAGPKWIEADQIQDGSATGIYAATLLGANITPPVNTTLVGRGSFAFDETTGELFYSVAFNSAPTGVSLVDSTSNTTIATLNGASTSYIGDLVLNAAETALFLNGDVAVVATSNTYPSGAVSGKISGYKGENVVVGIIDSGINSQHPSFAEVGEDGYRHLNPYGQNNFRGVCNPSNTFYNPDFECNNKLVGAWTFAATAGVENPANGISSPEDEDGHGSHTASTVAGNVVNSATVGAFDFGRVSGVAPHANIIAYDVCGYIDANNQYSASCPGTALYNAIAQAILDGVDVINYSISGGDDPWTDPFEQRFLLARDYGIIVSASAGNSGPTEGTVAHVSPWVMSVAAATHDRAVQKTLFDITDGTSTLPTITGAGATEPLLTPTEIIDAATLGNTYCGPFTGAAATAIAGKIVLCERGGGFGRVEKSVNVDDAGAAGFILMNDILSGPSFISDAYVLPGILISYDDGITLRDWLASSTGTPQAQLSTTNIVPNSSTNADKLASFSSRGPAYNVYANMLKPDLAAPGVDIMAAVADSGGATPDFDLYSGTSMSAPHVAGAAALLRGLDWSLTPGEIQSALIMTANSSMINHDNVSGTTPLDRGNGRVQLVQAAFAGLVIDETFDNFVDSFDTDAATVSALNVPSMASTECVVSCSWERTFRNTYNVPVTWNFSAEASGLTANPSSFTIPANGYQTVEFTLDVSSAPIGEYVFNRAILSESTGSLPDTTLSVAALARASSVPAIQDIESKTNVVDADINVTAAVYSNAAVIVEGLAKADAQSLYLDNEEVTYYEVTVPADTVRFVVDIRESPSLDLDLYIYYDSDNNEIYDTLVCQSATVAVLEYCSLNNPPAGNYLVEVENYEASTPAATDLVYIQTAVVPATDNGNLTIGFPADNTTPSTITVEQAFNIPSSIAGDSWYGAYSVVDSSGPTPVELAHSLIDFHHIWGAPHSLELVAGDAQSASVGSAFGSALEFAVTDDVGNRIPNIDVSFSAPTSGASATLSAATAQTSNDSDRVASITATANTTPGSYQVTATAGALSATVNLTNLTGPLSTLTLVAGDPQATAVGDAFADALEVQASDSYGNPISGLTITFDAPSSGASAVLSSVTATTDISGTASVTATANNIAGSYVVTASNGTESVEFNLTNNPGAIASLELVAGDAQSTTVGTAFGDPLTVKALDSSGNPIANATIAFSAPNSGASATLSSTTATTDANGEASVTATANNIAGSYTVTASVGSESVEFNLTNTVGAVANLELVAGDAQSAEIGKAFATALTVKATDSYGNLVPNATITFSVPSTGASAVLSATTAVTGANGQASVTATANNTAGDYKVTASVGGVSVEFNLSNTPAPAGPEPLYSIYLPMITR
jgi:subtilisin family serine protease